MLFIFLLLYSCYSLHFLLMAKIIFFNSIINNNLPPSWWIGTLGDGKQVYYKSWPKERARIFLRATESMQPFEDFCLTLTKMIEKNFFTCVSTGGACRSKGVQREKLWSSFHQLRTTKLADLWQGFLSQPNVPNLSPLVYQHVNQTLYEK